MRVVCKYGKERQTKPLQNITKQEVYDECYIMQELLTTLLACFYLDDSCDELVPNENWWKLSEEEQKKVREYFRGIE